MQNTQRKIIIGFATALGVVIVITLNPSIDISLGRRIKDIFVIFQEHGLPAWVTYRRIEFLANVALVVPLGYYLGRLLPMDPLWIGYACLPAMSVVIELTQKYVMPGRVAAFSDIVANSLGAWIGLTWAVIAADHVVDGNGKE